MVTYNYTHLIVYIILTIRISHYSYNCTQMQMLRITDKYNYYS